MTQSSDVQSEQTVATDISFLISDYQQGITSQRTAADVLEFVDNINAICEWMSSVDRLNFLKGLRTALTNSYWSASRIKMYMRPLLKMSGVDHADEWVMLALQESESSQSRLVRDIDPQKGLIISSTFLESHDSYIYVDDASYTGRTLSKYLMRICGELSKMQTKPRKLIIWHLLEYSRETFTRIGEGLAQLESLGVKVIFQRVEDLANKTNEGKRLGTLLPSSDCSSSPIVQRYLNSRPPLLAMKDNPALWRNPNDEFEDGLFASLDERNVVEKALLEVGCYLYLHTEQPQFRPLGYFASVRDVSFGFGSMFCTCHNSANTSPVAMWWGDPSKPKYSPLSLWKPLLPRIV
jgi:hypothetical protein